LALLFSQGFQGSFFFFVFFSCSSPPSTAFLFCSSALLSRRHPAAFETIGCSLLSGSWLSTRSSLPQESLVTYCSCGMFCTVPASWSWRQRQACLPPT
jgi:hypothetical protein